jgi:hypothetical protein
VKTVADQLRGKRLSWKGYLEDMANGGPGEPKSCRHPEIGERDDTQDAEVGDQYAARHNPFVYFHSIIDSPECAKRDVDLGKLPHDLKRPSTTPSFALIVPNLCDDGHDEPCVDGRPGGLVSADAWLKKQVPAILDSPGYRDDGLLIVTFDEAEGTGGEADASACCDELSGPNTINPGALEQGPGGGRIGAILISDFIRPGSSIATPYNHYSLLRSVENIFGLGHLGYAARPGLSAFGSEVFNQTPRLTIKARPRKLRRRRRRTLKVRVNRPARLTFAGACRRKPKRTDLAGKYRVRVKLRRRGRCRIRASRDGWRFARVRIRVK